MKQCIYTASNSETTFPKISRHYRHSSTGSKVLRGIKAGLQGERWYRPSSYIFRLIGMIWGRILKCSLRVSTPETSICNWLKCKALHILRSLNDKWCKFPYSQASWLLVALWSLCGMWLITPIYVPLPFRNPTKGIVINRPNGSDVYAGVPKDYTKEVGTKPLSLGKVQCYPMLE